MTTFEAQVGSDNILVEGSEALVLFDDKLVRTSVVATELLQMTAEPRDLAFLAAHCTNTFGPPPDGDALEIVATSVEKMVELGLMKRIDGP